MTRRTNARIAGIAYLLYIAVAYPSMVLSNRATSGEGMAAKLANMALHATDVRLAAVLSLIGCFCALVLAVTLYAITRDQDHDLAMLGLTCRVAEGITGAASIPVTLGLLAIATAAGTDAPDPGRRAQSVRSFSTSPGSSQRPSSPSAAHFSPGCSSGGGWFQSGWPVSASSHRLWWRWPCRCRLLRCSRDSSHVSCGCRSPFSSWCSRCG